MLTQVRIRWLMVAALLVLTSPAAAQRTAAGQLDAYIEKARQDWGVVGLAVAVVKDDSVVYARGFGVRETGRPERVDANTVFAIGSNTKAFTAAAIGVLVGEGRMSWDDAVTNHLPWFQLSDPWVTREITLRDLLSHRSGLARGDAIWYGTSIGREEVVRRVRFLEPGWSFRSRYGYQNIMYVATGLVVESATRASWDDFISQRFFQPLGMTRSTTSIRQLVGQDNVATPHSRVAGRIEAVPWRNIDNVAPAGSINSSVLDMSRWLRLQLADGTFQGRRIIPPATIREMRTPHITTGSGMDTVFPMTHFTAYGLGFSLRDYYGRRLIQHSGGIDGMLSQVAFVPEAGLGLVLLTNTDGQNAGPGLIFWLLDAFLDAPARDWNAHFLAQNRQARVRADSAAAAVLRARAANTSPSLPLERYTGTYASAMYGEAGITLEEGRLVVRRYDTFTGTLEHWHHDTFRVTWQQPRQAEPTMMTFALDAAGRITMLRVDGMGDFRRASQPGAR